MSASEQLIEISTRHAVYLERLKSGESNQFASFLLQTDKSIRDRLAGKVLTEFSRSRLERLLDSVEKQIAKIFDNYYNHLSGNLMDLAVYEAGYEARALNQVINGFEAVIPSENQVIAAVTSRPLSVRGPDGGKLLEPFIKDWSSVEIKRVSGAIRQGAFEGQTTTEIVRNIRGTKANKYRDGILAVTERNARTVAHTAVQHVSSQARQRTWEQNSDIVAGVEWVSTLDRKTSQICRSLSRKVFPIDKGPRPPIHPGCRSTTVAVLGSEYDFLDEGATQASVGADGGKQVDAGLSYYEWLKTQPEQFVQDAIGKSRAKLLLNGGISAERFAELNIGKNFNPLTLDEMRKLESVAFSRAGL